MWVKWKEQDPVNTSLMNLIVILSNGEIKDKKHYIQFNDTTTDGYYRWTFNTLEERDTCYAWLMSKIKVEKGGE